MPRIGRLELIDPGALKQDPSLPQHFFSASVYTRLTLIQYELAMDEIDRVIALIDAFLGSSP